MTTYSTPGTATFTAPQAGEYIVEAYGAGGGGRGALSLSAGGDGGAGGDYAAKRVTLTSGQQVTVTVGAPGAGTPTVATGAAAAAGDGAASSFGTYVVAAGGKGATASSPGAASTGSASTGDTRIGGDPGQAHEGYNGGAGGMAGGPQGGAGGASPGQSNGKAGNAPGGGGSGAGQELNTVGGAGGAGRVVVTLDTSPPSYGAKLDQYASVGSFTWTAPAAGDVLVQGVGSGGGGQGGSLLSGKGGAGGGAYADVVLTVAKGDQLAITIPAGGAGTAYNGGAGGNGGDAVVTRNGTVVLRAKGGLGSNGTTGAAGGQAADCVGTTRTSGLTGGNQLASQTNTSGSGGAGANPLGGPGGAGTQGVGNNGTAPGGGGSGGGGQSGGNGGSGGRGLVQVAYYRTRGTIIVDGKPRFVTSVSVIQGGVRRPATSWSVVRGGVRKPIDRLRRNLTAQLKAYPAWLPAGQEALFNRTTGAFNWAAGAPNLRAALAAGTDVQIVSVGDSITEGFTYLNDQLPYNFTADRLNSYPMAARNTIAAEKGLTIGGTGAVRAIGGAGDSDPRWTFNGGARGNSHVALTGGGEWAQFASDRPGTRVALGLIADPGATAEISIDGGAPIAWTSPTTLGPTRFEATGLAPQKHTVRITRTAGNVRVATGDVYTPGGIRVHDVGHGGATAAGTSGTSWSATDQAWNNLLPLYSSAQALYGRTPDAVTIMLGTNDLNGSNSGSWTGNYDTIRNAVAAIGDAFDGSSTDIILLTPPHFSPVIHSGLTPSIPHYQRLLALAQTKGWAVVDVEWLTGGFEPLQSQGYTGDNFGHLSTAGAIDTGGKVGRALLTAA